MLSFVNHVLLHVLSGTDEDPLGFRDFRNTSVAHVKRRDASHAMRSTRRDVGSAPTRGEGVGDSVIFTEAEPDEPPEALAFL